MPEQMTASYYGTDTGCNLHPKCLECPRPQCKYDDEDEGRSPHFNARHIPRHDEEILALYHKGWTSYQIAQKVGMVPSGVGRALRRQGLSFSKRA